MRQALFLLDWTPINRRYLPGRGLAGSIVVHALVLCALLFVTLPGNVKARLRSPEDEIAYINLKDPDDVLYLPVMGSEPDDASPSDAPHAHIEAPAVASAPKVKGLSYPGPQSINSDFPNATNSILTVLQPTLVNPSVLRPPLMLPNIVQMPAVAAPPPIPAAPVPDAMRLSTPQVPMNPELQAEVKPVDLPVKLTPPPVDIPKPALPTIAALNPIVPEARQLPQTSRMDALDPASRLQPKVQAPPEAPAKPVEPLLVLTPMPAPRQETLNVPSGEARGRFSISPDANIASLNNDPGVRTESVASVANNVTKPATAPKDKVSPAPAADNTRSGRGGSTTGTGTSAASGISVGTNNNAFPGISILGGPSDTGNARTSTNIISLGTAPPPIQTSYGITIVSTEGSGGGLPQYGVFTNEQIFTVYLDMRKTVSDTVPSWTFEYAALKPKSAQTTLPINASAAQQGLVLPFPITREQPVLPADLVRKYSRLRIIVYAVINTDGKMEQVSVKESPDAMMNGPVVTALAKWSFRPAQLDGEKVPMKVLIGIPLS